MQPNIGTPQIEGADYQISRSVSGQWKLTILWRFKNRNNQVLYMLLTNPLPIIAGDYITLDHSSPGDSDELYFNVVPGFEIAAIPPADTAERWLSCNLELPDSVETISVVGKFGYSYAPPDPDWERTKNWMQVGKWQQIADSDALLVSLKNQSPSGADGFFN